MLSLALLAGQSIAAPVEVNQAMHIGLKYLQSNSSNARQFTALNHVYTQNTEAGTPALYVFNADGGYVIVAADDVAQPVLAFSAEESFNVNDIPDGVKFFLRLYAEQIGYAVEHNIAQDAETKAQWEHVMRDGFVNDNRGTTDVGPLLTTSWNQDCYYNMLCPTSTNWMAPCGHVYAGCAATAMSMVMQYWSWPEQGNGSYSYTPSGYPTQSADFGSTTYDWANMPNSLSASSSTVQKQAIALLMWHCGISIDMKYNYNGSGAHSEDVPDAIVNYFRYTNKAEIKSKDLYTKTEWENLLISQLDEGFPMYYAGSDTESGHAFACVGYRSSDRKFRFNWGWSGSYNSSYFAIDALTNVSGYNLNLNQRAIIDFLPDYIYDGLIPAAADLTVTSENANSKKGIISWTNPTTSLDGQALTNIEKVVLLRNGQQIFSQNNVAPGQAMQFEDIVNNFDCYDYRLYFVSNGVKGRFADLKYQYGPTCTWKVICQTTNFQGWNKGKLQVLNSFGNVIEEISMTNSTPMSKSVRMPEGDISLKWVAPENVVNSLTINVKNSANATVYTYSGSSNNLSGVVYSDNNDCGGCLAPTGLTCEYQWSDDNFGAMLTWNYDNDPQSFKVYRSTDGVNYVEVATVDKALREYFDQVETGSYYYKVTAFRSYCESTPAWTDGGNDFVYINVTSVDDNQCAEKLFPNPVSQWLTVEAEGLSQVVVYNMTGQEVYSKSCNEDVLVINASDFAPGIYAISIKTATANVTRRFTVVH